MHTDGMGEYKDNDSQNDDLNNSEGIIEIGFKVTQFSRRAPTSGQVRKVEEGRAPGLRALTRLDSLRKE